MVQKYKKVLSTFAHLQNKYTIHTKINYSEKKIIIIRNNRKQEARGSQVGGWGAWSSLHSPSSSSPSPSSATWGLFTHNKYISDFFPNSLMTVQGSQRFW